MALGFARFARTSGLVRVLAEPPTSALILVSGTELDGAIRFLELAGAEVATLPGHISARLPAHDALRIARWLTAALDGGRVDPAIMNGRR